MEKLRADIHIKNVNIIDVEKGEVAAGQDVLIRDQKIIYIGKPLIKEADIKVAIDGEGKYLVPGFWDMHVHTLFDGFYQWQFPLMLANGIIGFRDMWGDKKMADSARRMMSEGDLPAFHFKLSGHIADGKKPYWPGSVSLPDKFTAVKSIDSLIDDGAHFIKIYSGLTVEVFDAVAARCRERKIPFAGHVPQRVSVSSAAKAGMSTMEHLYGFATEASTASDEIMQLVNIQQEASETGKGMDSLTSIARKIRELQLSTFSPDKVRAVAKTLREQNTYVVPTMVAMKGFYFSNDSNMTNDPRIKYMPEFIRSEWRMFSENTSKKLLPADWAKRKLVFENEKTMLSILSEEKVMILAGSDIVNPYTYAGFSLHDELALFVESGMSNAASLRTSTINAAKYMKMSDSLGTVQEGKRADLVLLDANPLVDIRNTRKINAVISGGRVYTASELEEMKKKVEALHSMRK